MQQWRGSPAPERLPAPSGQWSVLRCYDLQDGLTKLHQGDLVINEEHTLCPRRDISKERPLLRYVVLSQVSAAGKIDRERRPLAYDTGDAYSTPMVRDDAVHEGQPHACPLA